MIKVSAAATVMISREEYHHLTRGDRRVMGLEDFTDEDVAALEEIRAPQAAKAFDSELRRWFEAEAQRQALEAAAAAQDPVSDEAAVMRELEADLEGFSDEWK